MYCKYCRNQIPEGAKFCSTCGASVITQPTMNSTQPEQQTTNNIPLQQSTYNTTPNEPPKSSKKGLFIAIMIVIIGLIVLGIYYFKNKNNQESQQIEQNNTETNKDNKTGIEEENPNEEINDDSNINTTYDANGAFLFSIEDLFTITGRGTVVTGQVLRGKLNVNDEVQVIGLNHEVINTIVTAIEASRENKDYAIAGDNVGLFLKDVSRDTMERGQVVIEPNSMGVYTKLKANIYVLTKDEGGRHTPFFSNFQPQFYFRAANITGTITLPADLEMAMPGDNIKEITVELKRNVAMEVGTEFDIKENNRKIGSGTVTEIIE